jgi:hypothetical protein
MDVRLERNIKVIAKLVLALHAAALSLGKIATSELRD